MSSRSRNFRRRGDDEDENEGNDSSAIPATTRKVSSKPKKLLSFAEDEDEGGEDITKSSRRASSKPSSHKLTSSHKLSLSKERLPANPLSKTSNVQPQAGIYTKEALLDLQKRTPTLAKSTASTKSTSSSSEPKIILKGLLKPSSNDDAVSLFERPVEDEDKEQEEKQKDAVGDSTDTENQFASMGLEKSIPDEETIKRIKAKKERMRMSRTAAPDYISLDGGSNQGTAEGFSDEEPEFTTRIAMIGKEDKNNHGVFADIDNDGSDDEKIRVRTMISNVGSFASNVDEDGSKVDVADDEDEEDKIWEEEQFRKGLGKRMDNGSAPTVLPSETPAMMHNQQQPQRPLAYGSIPNTGGAFSTTQGLDALSIPQQAEVAKKALQDSIRRLKESHDRTNLSLTKTAENLSGSLMNITNLEKSLTVAGEKFVFIQKLRDFVSVICEFLQHKAPYIEELEAHLQAFCEDRASANRERRAADNDDEMKEVEAAVKAAMLVFSERGNSAAVIATATGAAESALAAFREQTNLPVDLDEFGRDKNQKRRMDMKRRTEARLRRKAQFDAKRLSSMEVDGSNKKIEGESSTDESDSESSAYESARSQYLQTADQIFSDASEEYSQLSLVIERFETWKKEYARSYQDAYMSLNAPAIFSPYVRLELLKWDPLHESKDFLDMKWHSLLFNYGSPEDGSDFKSDDADANLVPELVEKVAIPMLRHAISQCWDTLSTRETENAVFATNLVISYVSASNKALVDLLLAINERLSMAVEGIKVPTWSPLVLKAVPSAARVAAYRFGMSVRLMRNICLWKDVLSLPVLEKLVLDNLLGGKILPHIRSIASNVHDAVARSERVVAALSGVWTGTSVTAENSKKLKSLVDYVVSLGRILEKKQASGVSETETSGLARRLKKMLVELNDYDNARNVVKTFHLKEAL